MFKKKDEKDVVAPAKAQTAPSDVAEEPAVEVGEPQVVQHLDRDPNDPRNVEPTPVLPSLNDPGQS